MKYKSIEKYPFSGYIVKSDWKYLEETLKQWGDRVSIQGNLGLNLDPEFQRGHVWTEEKQIAYVEYCLMGGEGARTLIFNHPNWGSTYVGELVLVDEKQRLEAVRKFMRNELPVFNGNYLNDFEDKEIMLRSMDCSFTVQIHQLPNDKEVMKFYLKLNSGGVVHTQEELDKVKKLIDKA